MQEEKVRSSLDPSRLVAAEGEGVLQPSQTPASQEGIEVERGQKADEGHEAGLNPQTSANQHTNEPALEAEFDPELLKVSCRHLVQFLGTEAPQRLEADVLGRAGILFRGARSGQGQRGEPHPGGF
jgi:hypothetical protein